MLIPEKKCDNINKAKNVTEKLSNYFQVSQTTTPSLFHSFFKHILSYTLPLNTM